MVSLRNEWVNPLEGGGSDLLNGVTGEIFRLWDVVDKEQQKRLLKSDLGSCAKKNNQASGILGKACEG